MKTKQMMWAVCLILLCVLFQNSLYIGDQTLAEIKNRKLHAKEVLGEKYNSKLAKLHTNNKLFNTAFSKRVHSRLPSQYKHQANAITKTIIVESQKFELDPVFIMAIIETESSFRPNAVGPVGEIGLMQLRLETAEWLSQKIGLKWRGAKTLKDPIANIKLGVAYVNWLRSTMKKNSIQYVSAYNMGPKNVRRLVAQNIEPVVYRKKIMEHYVRVYHELIDKKPILRAVKTAKI